MATIKPNKFIATGLAVTAMLAATAGATMTANADEPADLEDIEYAIPIMTFGDGTDAHAGQYSYDVKLLPYYAESEDEAVTPVVTLGTVSNDIDLGRYIPGVSAADLTGIIKGITVDQLKEWAGQNLIYTREYGDYTRYRAEVALIQRADGAGVETLGGYALDNGRASVLEMTWEVGDDGTVDFYTGTPMGGCGAVSAMPSSLSLSDMSTRDNPSSEDIPFAFCNIPEATEYHAVGHKHWQGDGEDVNLNEAYKDTFDLDLTYKSASGTLTPPPTENNVPRSLNGIPYVFTNGTDARWDRNGDIDFGTIAVSLSDALNLDTNPLDLYSGSGMYDTSDMYQKFDGNIVFRLEEDGRADQVTKPESLDDVTVDVTWDPDTNLFHVDSDSDIIVTNTYTAPKRVTVGFDTQTGDVTNPSDQSLDPGQTARDPAIQREGYRFTGWYMDPECTIPYDFATPVQEDITLYAGWEKTATDTFTVLFDAQAEGVTNPEAQTVEPNAFAVEPDVSRDGYEFTGWYMDPECTTPFDFSTPVTGDITLYAGWEHSEAGDDTTDVDEPEDVKPGDDTQSTMDAGTGEDGKLAQTGSAIGGAAAAMIGALLVAGTAAMARRRAIRTHTGD